MISCEDICLLSTIIYVDGTLLVVLKAETHTYIDFEVECPFRFSEMGLLSANLAQIQSCFAGLKALRVKNPVTPPEKLKQHLGQLNQFNS